MKKQTKEKIDEFIDSSVEALLALSSLGIDAFFWVMWGLSTSWSGKFIESLSIASEEIWPYKIAQFCGCGVLALFVIFRTAKDSISLWDSFREYLDNRK